MAEIAALLAAPKLSGLYAPNATGIPYSVMSGAGTAASIPVSIPAVATGLGVGASLLAPSIANELILGRGGNEGTDNRFRHALRMETDPIKKAAIQKLYDQEELRLRGARGVAAKNAIEDFGYTFKNEGIMGPPEPNIDVLALIDRAKRVSGAGGAPDLRDLNKASDEDRKAYDDLAARLESFRAAKGQLDSQKPLSKIFDAASEYEKLRKQIPDERPDNSMYWAAQAMPSFRNNERVAADTSQAARLMFDIDKAAISRRNDKIAQQLGWAKDMLLGENLNAQEEHARLLAPILAQMPGNIDLELLRGKSRVGAEAAKAQINAQHRASQAARESAIDQSMRYLREGVKGGAIHPQTFEPIGKAGEAYMRLTGLAPKKEKPNTASPKDIEAVTADAKAYMDRLKIDQKTQDKLLNGLIGAYRATGDVDAAFRQLQNKALTGP